MGGLLNVKSISDSISLLVYWTKRTLRKVGNLFIVSLAISDLFVACLVMVFAVANDLQGYWVFGERFCDIWIAFDVMCSTVRCRLNLLKNDSQIDFLFYSVQTGPRRRFLTCAPSQWIGKLFFIYL